MEAKKSSDPLVEKLAATVEDLTAKEPYEWRGLKWAARPQSYYYKTFGVSPATLRRRIAQPPFVRGWPLVNGKRLCLLRLGEARPKDAGDYKRIMAHIWKQKFGKEVTRKEGQCLWGMTGDILIILDAFNSLAKLSLPAELGGELAIAMFKYAISEQGWPDVAIVIRGWEKELPNGKARYYKYPSITVIRNSVTLALRAYLEAASSGWAKYPDGYEKFIGWFKFGSPGEKFARFVWELIVVGAEMEEETGEEASEPV